MTVNAFALLDPAAVTTTTFALPNRAFSGTLHLIRVELHETYFVHLAEPNVT